jgi:beta-lactam-binding protein with PASTA domain
MLKRIGVGIAAGAGASAVVVGALGPVTGAGAYTVPKVCKVPTLIGQAAYVAESKLTSANCGVGTISTAVSSQQPAGDVISDNPAAGTSHAAGYAVGLLISLGKPASTVQCVMPKVGGKSAGTAVTLITRAHCGVGKITTSTSKTVPKGDVITASLSTGATKSVGYKVKLTVSGGKSKSKPKTK